MTAEAMTEILVQRITDDAGYCEKRLGVVVSEEKARKAATPVAERAVEAFAEWLDQYESDVWTTLEDGIAEREALRREERQAAMLDAGPILADYRRAKGELE